MNKKTYLGMLLIGSFLLLVLSSTSAVAEVGGDEKTITKDTSLTFHYDTDPPEVIEENPTPPDIEEIVGNIDSFSNPEDTVYLDDDVIPSELLPGMEWVRLKIELTAIKIYDDHNSGGEGDIFIRYVPNFWIGEPKHNGWTNYDGNYLDTAIYLIEDENPAVWSNFTEPIVMYDDYTIQSCMYMNVFEEDALGDDDLGWFGWWYENPQDIVGYHEYSTINAAGDDWGDADLAFNITILDTLENITAADMTEIFQPFLFDDDGTDTADPDGLFARVIHGYDPQIEMEAFCIQYLYYWGEVWFDGFFGDDFVHYDDYELVQIYVNITYTSGIPMAYRFVFDNHDTLDNTDTEWRDSMEYNIYEWFVEEGYEILEKVVYNSEDLRPLLGEKYTAQYQYRNMSKYVEHYCGCYGGVPSIMLTLATYNHQFAMGDDGGDMLGQYYIEPYTDDIIEICYLLVNDSFSGGIHDINGEMVANYAPFAYDVKQVFEVPYIHSNFNHLMLQAVEFQGDTEAKGGNIAIDKNLGITIDIPCEAEMTLPATLNPGDTFETDVEITISPDATTITLDMFLNLSISYDIFFYSGVFESILDEQIIIDFSDPIFSFILDSLGVNDEQTGGTELLDGMVTVEYAFTPQILGNIFNSTIAIHIDEIVKHYLPQFAWLVDLLLEDVALTINPVLDGFISADMFMGDESEELLFDEETETFTVSFTVPELNTAENLEITIAEFNYGLNFYVNWGIDLIFSDLMEIILPSRSYELGVYPNVTVEIPFSGTESLDLDHYYALDTEDVWIRSDIEPESETTDDDTDDDTSKSGGIPGYSAFGIISTLAVAMTIFMVKQKRT